MLPPPVKSSNRRVGVGLALAVIVIGAWWVWSRGAARPAGGGLREPAAFLQLVGAERATAGRVLRERAELLDPTPLFVPTAKNFGQGGLPVELQRQPGRVFQDFEAKFQFEEGGLRGFGLETGLPPESLPEILAQANEAPFAGFGETEPRRTPLGARTGFVAVKSLQAGGLTLEEALPAEAARTGDFAPMEFLVTVAPSGLIGEPLLMIGSGATEVDEHFRTFLMSAYQIDRRLPPGNYRVTIGP